MRIFSGLGRAAPNLQAGRSQAEGLNKADLVSDIFNNRGGDSEEERPEVKLRLSKMSKRLMGELRTNVESFLQDNPEIDSELKAFSLEDIDTSNVDGLSVQIRKMRVYLNWLELKTDDVTEQEKPFTNIFSLGKDESIRALFQETDMQRQKYQKEQLKAQPTYYYRAFPEAYSFN